MEKFTANLRVILCANSTSKIIGPIRSRCLLLRVGAPSEDQVGCSFALVRQAARLLTNSERPLADRRSSTKDRTTRWDRFARPRSEAALTHLARQSPSRALVARSVVHSGSRVQDYPRESLAARDRSASTERPRRRAETGLGKVRREGSRTIAQRTDAAEVARDPRHVVRAARALYPRTSGPFGEFLFFFSVLSVGDGPRPRQEGSKD